MRRRVAHRSPFEDDSDQIAEAFFRASTPGGEPLAAMAAGGL